MAVTPDPLMNVDQIKNRLECCRSYVYRLIEDGRLHPALRLGRRRGIRVRRSVVEAFIIKQEADGIE